MGTRTTIRVAELFAGVGGFRLGLEAANERTGDVQFEVVWSNQWEPSTKRQHASDIYSARFGATGHSNEDISTVSVDDIPDHQMLVGGFPCQDYSVARTLNQAAGLVGKKGVLWWQIHRVLKEKRERGTQPTYLVLENVDRLLKSPATQRGRDFAIMLASLIDLDYVVEWRVINAADYGFPQRRRRVFVVAYHKDCDVGRSLRQSAPENWVHSRGPLARGFPVENDQRNLPLPLTIEGDLATITNLFNEGGGSSPFLNAGVALARDGARLAFTFPVKPTYDGPRTVLKDVLLPEAEIPSSYFIEEDELEQWRFQKGAKSLERTSRKNGHVYRYTEGGMAFPEPLDQASRTVVTGEGGRSPSRFKHVVRTASGRYRRLTPVELERLNMFPDGHTEGASEVRRAFLMGNALVVGVVRDIATSLGRELAETGVATVAAD